MTLLYDEFLSFYEKHLKTVYSKFDYRHSVQQSGTLQMIPKTWSPAVKVGQSTTNSSNWMSRKAQTSSGALPFIRFPSRVNVPRELTIQNGEKNSQRNVSPPKPDRQVRT